MTSAKSERIAIIGTGYVGLTTGACLAHLGHNVICVDIDDEKVDLLRLGVIPIYEQGLSELVGEGLKLDRLEFTTDTRRAVAASSIIFMCLPTPQGADGSADLSFLLSAAREIGPALRPGSVVVNKSTVPAGSADKVMAELGRADIYVASNPEFLREGTAVHDFFSPDRIVIGAQKREVAERVSCLYAAVNASKLLTDTVTAELIKYGSNAFLAAKISFANSMATLCERMGADAHAVLEGMGADDRIGEKFLNPGPGWGGSCFPKDVFALLRQAEEVGYDFGLLRSVVRTNEEQLDRMVDVVLTMLGRPAIGCTVAIWGLSFKANTDDVRESPAIKIAQRLLALGARVRAYDPSAHGVLPEIERADSALEACEHADILMVLTEWPEFVSVPMDEVARRLRAPRVVDARNMLDHDELLRLGFLVFAVGQGYRIPAGTSWAPRGA